jgi:hypothetical protein
MIVWGGDELSGSFLQDGGRYDPSLGTWSPTSLARAPYYRYRHTAVWTGDAMIVWGGWFCFNPNPLHSGGVYFADADWDADGAKNACDCAHDDPLAFNVPSEIGNLRWLADAVTLEWDSDAPNSGPGTSYDVVRGGLSELPVGGTGEVCLEPDSEDTISEDSTTPTGGFGFCYLVRGQNSCGAGGYGTDSTGIPRASDACP